jgi:hypothetical protein
MVVGRDGRSYLANVRVGKTVALRVASDEKVEAIMVNLALPEQLSNLTRSISGFN